MRGLTRWACTVFVGVASAVHYGNALSGGGPETTLIVINADSAISARIANAYAALRDIPPNHLVWLNNIPSLETIDVATFRERIWNPIRDFLSVHKLDEHIDTIVYSGDFPYAVDLSADIRANKLPKARYRGRIGSLTGVTFFARRVGLSDAGYLTETSNQYFRRNLAPATPARALSTSEIELARRAERAFERNDYSAAAELYGTLTRLHPDNSRAWYHLARSLAVLGQRDAALDALQRAVGAGWANSMVARHDPRLQELRSVAGFPELLARMEARNGPFEPTQGFRSRYTWRRWGLPALATPATDLDRYYLSTMLAYTGVNGNSVPEVLRYLATAADSDGTKPNGTVYLLVNPGIRSKTRQRFFPETVRALRERGHRAEILVRGEGGQNGILPSAKNDVIGAVVGARRFDWEQSQSRLLPGAIVESLTSYGGTFNRRSQTKLTEFLRHGAAGSSGAVAEPFSIAVKFPSSMLHVYYADGCSLAEAFYQSIASPYQLIIVGDPLARPFAEFATVRLTDPDPALPWQGTVVIRTEIIPAAQRPVEGVELWVDGIPVATAGTGESITWDTRAAEDGGHEVRLVAVEAGRIETRSYAKYRISVANTHHRAAIDHTHLKARLGDDLHLSGSAPGARRVEVLHGDRAVYSTEVADGRWRIPVPADRLGPGRSSVTVRTIFSDGAAIRSRALEVEVLPPVPNKSSQLGTQPAEGLKGVLVTKDGEKRDIVLTSLDGRLGELGKESTDVEYIRLTGQVHLPKTGFYQFIVNSRGKIRVAIGDRNFDERRLDQHTRELFLPLSLEAGWHDLSIELFPAGRPRLKVVVAGEQVADVLHAKILRHDP